MKSHKENKKHPNKVLSWISTHKIELSLGIAITVLSGIGIAYRCKYKNSKVIEKITEPIGKIIEVNEQIAGTSKSPHPRSSHVRNIGDKFASKEKIKEALANNVYLNDHETFVTNTFVNAS